MITNSTHRTPEYAGWGALDGIDLKKDIEQLEHIEHDIERIRQALYHERRVLNHAYHDEEDEHFSDEPDEMQEKVGRFHKRLVEEVIAFCDENEICPKAMSLNIDMLDMSIKHGFWTSATDSALIFSKDDRLENIMYESI